MLVEVVHLVLDGQLKKLHLVLEGLIGELEPRDSVPVKYWVSNKTMKGVDLLFRNTQFRWP